MSKTITLPSGATAEIREPQTLLKKDRDKVLANASEHTEGLMQAVALQDGLIAVSVLSWSFDLVPPSIKITSLGELSLADYQALADESLKAQEYLFPTLDAGNQDDPKAPTANFNV
jgi:hypothetical protein